MKRIDVVSALLRIWLIATLAFMVAPLVFVLVNSFNASPFSNFPPSGLSLHWYESALTYEPFQSGLRRSAVVALGATGIALVVGTLAAVGLVRYRFRGSDALRTFFISPMVVPKVALGFAVFILFLRVADVLNARDALAGSPLSLVLVHSLIGLPLVVIIVSATLVGMDPALEEAAADLGASPAQTFRLVMLPLLAQGMATAAVFAFMFSFDEVESAIFLSPIAGRTLPVEMFLLLERQQDPTLAALSSLLVFAAFAVVLAMMSRIGVEKVVRTAQRSA